MHSYSIDTNIRRTSYVILGVLAFVIPNWIISVQSISGLSPKLAYPINFGVTFGILHFVFDKWAWKALSVFSLIQDLSGTWRVEGVSSYGEGTQFYGEVRIKQTFSRIEIFSTFDQSVSRSILAGLCLDQAMPSFRYAFENTPKNMSDIELQRHPGLIDLRIVAHNEMTGDYFSGKHRLRYGEMTLRREK